MVNHNYALKGYNWNNGQILRKKGNVDAGYMPLKLENGRIMEREGSDRLSKPLAMNRNFLETVRAEYSAKGLKGEALENAVKAEKARVQVHHLIPDEIVQTSELGKAAKKAGYDLDEGSNLKGLPRTAKDRLDEFDVEHRGSHPEYSKAVKLEMEKTAEELKLEYKTLDNVPKDVIKRKMKEIEDKFRLKIERNEVKIKDGKLAIMQDQIGGGRNNVRV
jgi:A nuclease family of the HNH/ENDO VII superfamily with conserved AHH